MPDLSSEGARGSTRADGLASEDVRRHNLALVARHIAATGPVARSEIAAATGLSRGSVTALTAALVDAAILAEAEPEPAARRGRRLQKLSIFAPHLALVAVQIDADHVSVVTADLTGTELARSVASHGRPLRNPGSILDLAATELTHALADAALAGRRVVDVTIVMFAPVAGHPPIVVADTDLEWGPVDVVAGLRERCPALRADIPVHLVADVLVAAAAEFAEQPGIADALYIKSDSGIGGAALVHGILLRGAHGMAGAFGHIAIVPDGELCSCGQRGCLVTVAGPDALLHRAGMADVLAEHGLTTAIDLFVTRVERAEPAAVAAWQEGARWVGHALHVLALAFDPALIVVGGFWASLAGDIDAAFQAKRPVIEGEPLFPVAVVAGGLGTEAALRGALREACARLLADPLALADRGQGEAGAHQPRGNSRDG